MRAVAALALSCCWASAGCLLQPDESLLADGGAVAFEGSALGRASDVASVSTVDAPVARAGALVLAFVSSKPLQAVSSVSGMGLTWTEVRSQCGARGSTGVSLWRGSGDPTAERVTATLDGAPRSAVLAVAVYGGVDQLGRVVSTNTLGDSGPCTGGADSATYAMSLAAPSDAAVVVGAVAIRLRSDEPQPPTIERLEVAAGSAGDTAGLAVLERVVDDGGGPTPLSGTLSSPTDWAALAVELIGAR